MSNVNDFLPVAQAVDANVESQTDYLADSQRTEGQQPGIAKSAFNNKALRQATAVISQLAQLTSDRLAQDVLDNADLTTLYNQLAAAFPNSSPVGSLILKASPAVPSGYLATLGAAVSRTTYAALFADLVTSQGFTSQTCTMTIASPCVVSKTAHGFVGGERLRFSTTGALPTGVSNTLDYFVSVIDANTFNLQTEANILGGTFVNTTGSQSGTQSYLQSLYGLGNGTTTFNVPNTQGLVVRAFDGGRSINQIAAYGSLQMDQFQGHWHSIQSLNNLSVGGSTNGNLDGTSPVNNKVNNPVTDGANGTPRFGGETRVKAIIMSYFIKF